MRRILLALLVIVVGVGLFAAIGYAGYRAGYAQGVQATRNNDAPLPRLRPFDDFGPRGMPRHDFGFDRGFPRGFGPRGFPMMGFGLFFFLRWLVPLAVLALVIGSIVWLFSRSGWRFTRQTVSTTPTGTETIAETKTENE